MSNFVNYSNATDIMTAVGNKIKALAGAFIPKGSVLFSNIPSTPTASELGFVYNITDAFTTDARFVEGAGKDYPAGTNIAVVDVGGAGSPDIKYDVMAGFIDVATINAAIAAVLSDIADAFDATQAYAIDDIVTYQNVLYKFTSAHTANDPWDPTEVTTVKVEDLISSAEPNPLTTSEVNALIALLG